MTMIPWHNSCNEFFPLCTPICKLPQIRRNGGKIVPNSSPKGIPHPKFYSRTSHLCEISITCPRGAKKAHSVKPILHSPRTWHGLDRSDPFGIWVRPEPRRQLDPGWTPDTVQLVWAARPVWAQNSTCPILGVPIWDFKPSPMLVTIWCYLSFAISKCRNLSVKHNTRKSQCHFYKEFELQG